MNKKIAAVVLGFGFSLGVGANMAFGAASPLQFVHAVDLRRELRAGIESKVRITAFASDRTNGGKDFGRASECKVSNSTAANAKALMDALAKECSW